MNCTKGKGSFGSINVYVAKHTSTEEGYAVKRVNLEDSEFPIDHIQVSFSAEQAIHGRMMTSVMLILYNIDVMGD